MALAESLRIPSSILQTHRGHCEVEGRFGIGDGKGSGDESGSWVWVFSSVPKDPLKIPSSCD
jgi:hypothetical protein